MFSSIGYTNEVDEPKHYSRHACTREGVKGDHAKRECIVLTTMVTPNTSQAWYVACGAQSGFASETGVIETIFEGIDGGPPYARVKFREDHIEAKNYLWPATGVCFIDVARSASQR